MFKKLSSVLFKIKAFYKRFALILGIVIPICLYLFMPGVSVFTTPLSFFGITPKTQTLWIVFNQLMAIALLMFGLKANESLADHPKIKKRKKILEVLLVIAILAFSSSGMITMDIHIPHLTLAGIFFLVYVGYIFWYGYFSKHKNIAFITLVNCNCFIKFNCNYYYILFWNKLWFL